MFDIAYLEPGITSSYETVESELTWGPQMLQVKVGGVIASTVTDAGNTSTDVLRHGLLLAKKTSDGLLYNWDPTATDGTQDIFGILMVDVKMQHLGTGAARFVGPILIAGLVKAAKILPPSAAAQGISGVATEYMIRSLLTQTGRFILDDEYQGCSFGFKRIVPTAVGATVTAADNNTLFLTTGATATSTFTLPAPKIGLRIGFLNVVDYTMTINSASASQIIGDNTTTGSSVSFSTASCKIGRGVIFYGISATKWVCQPMDYGTTLALTGDLTVPADIVLGTANTGVHNIILEDDKADALSINDGVGDFMVFTTTTGSQAIAVTPATTFALTVGVTGVLTATGGIVIPGAVDLAFTGTTGQPELVVPTNLADALSIKDSAGDLIVFTTTTGTPSIAITPIVTFAGAATFNGVLRRKVIATPVAATGSALADAAAVGVADTILISSDSAAKGVKLLTGVAGDIKRIINTSSTAAKLWPAASGTLNGVGASGAVVIPASKGVVCICTAADTWTVFDMTALAGTA